MSLAGEYMFAARIRIIEHGQLILPPMDITVAVDKKTRVYRTEYIIEAFRRHCRTVYIINDALKRLHS